MNYELKLQDNELIGLKSNSHQKKRSYVIL